MHKYLGRNSRTVGMNQLASSQYKSLMRPCWDGRIIRLSVLQRKGILGGAAVARGILTEAELLWSNLRMICVIRKGFTAQSLPKWKLIGRAISLQIRTHTSLSSASAARVTLSLLSIPPPFWIFSRDPPSILQRNVICFSQERQLLKALYVNAVKDIRDMLDKRLGE